MYQEYRIKSEFAEIHTEIANETVSITGGSDGPTSVFLRKDYILGTSRYFDCNNSNDGYNYN